MRGDQLPAVLTSSVNAEGFAITQSDIHDSIITALIEHFETAIDPHSTIKRNGSAFAMRNLLRDHEIIRDLADSAAMRAMVDPLLGPNAIAVRGILFDKTPGANWTVPWHQDLSIAVKQRVDLAGYGPWSVKAGVPHVQPPVEVLQQMLTVRLHLDDCGSENGPLLVLPGTHQHGILSAIAVNDLTAHAESIACKVKRGDAVLMRPLLLHGSHAAASPAHRRVVHIEYAATKLAPTLQWLIA